MLLRSLVAVMMLAGPLPGRLCTCAASARPTAPEGEQTEQPPRDGKTCACGHRSKSGEPAFSCDQTPIANSHSDSDRGDQVPADHERDCPAVNPTPAASAVTVSTEAELPDDSGLSEPAWLDPVFDRTSDSPRSCLLHQAIGSTPLYISLLTLRN